MSEGQSVLNFDVCVRKSRHDQNSAAAFQRGKRNHQAVRFEILKMLDERGSLTLKEFCDAKGIKSLNRVSGRFSDCQRMKLIIKTDARREGCGVWVRRKGEAI